MGDRKIELQSILAQYGEKAEIEARQLIDEIVFIENELIHRKTMPFIVVNPQNPAIQKTTPAFKQYRELLQQYNNCLRMLVKIAGDVTEGEAESPLQKWVKRRGELLNNGMDARQ